MMIMIPETSANIYLFNLINHFAGENVILDKIMVFIASYFVFTIPLFLIYLWFKKENKKDVLFIFSSVLASLAIAQLITLIYFHPRPFMLGLGKKLIPHGSETSFPSDHATVMFAVAFSLIFLKKNKEGMIFLIFSLLVGLARVFCGVHFPFDIIGSFFVALIGTVIIFMLKDVF